MLDPEALAQRAVDILADHQALDIVLLDISRTATFADYFVIATAQSPLQFSALHEYLEKGLGEDGHDLRHREGSAASGWKRPPPIATRTCRRFARASIRCA